MEVAITTPNKARLPDPLKTFPRPPESAGGSVAETIRDVDRHKWTPRPSDSPLDPLVRRHDLPLCQPHHLTELQNWSRQKREAAYASLLLALGTIGMSKTMLFTLNSVLASQFHVSYQGITTLTGIPLIFAPFAGMGARVLAQKWGKRTLMLASSMVMLISLVLTMHTNSYGRFMTSRFFQGLAWGVLEAMALDAVRDMFYVSAYIFIWHDK